MPKISVIIPVYNTEQYLKECLDSVINQTLKDIEIIIINDASPDNSISIINDYASKDGRIVVIDKKNNEGVGQARNDGILKATGEFIAFMDSDDLYSSETALHVLYNAVLSNGVNVAGGYTELLSDDGVKLQNNPITIYSVDFFQQGLMNYSDYQYDYGYTCYIFNRDMLIEKNILFPKYSRFQDPPFYVKAMAAADIYYYVDKPIYRYRIIQSETKNTAKKTLDMLDGIADNLVFSEKEGLVKLHYLTAMRLYKDASYMAAHNISDDDFPLILEKFITAMNAVNKKMIETEGYYLPTPFIPEVFSYMHDATMKYEKLRNNKIAKMISKVLKH